MGTLRGLIRDADSGAPVAAKVRVVTHAGQFVNPAGAVLKVGSGDSFFYSDGDFRVSVPGGTTRIVVERGTEYEPLELDVATPTSGVTEVDLDLKRWTDLPAQGWYPGNTHIHYNETEADPDARLRLDPEVHDLSLTAVSVLRRGDLPYATNRYPPGFLTEFSTDHRHVICGEETRHNSRYGGYGHVMLLELRNLVEPVSRGDLVSAFDPDYPPLCYACDDARTQGGLVIWCHNGHGSEAPVAAALGKLHAFNLFDPTWKSTEYEIWYHLLNCGIRLPASTGSDWFICSNNRVYVDTEGAPFSHLSWAQSLQAGRSFITNGPSLLLRVADAGPGTAVAGGRLPVRVTWQSHLPLTEIEVVVDGRVAARRELRGTEAREGYWEVEVQADDGWVAARTQGVARDSFCHPVYAHASPVYVGSGRPAAAAESAAFFLPRLDAALESIRTQLRFTTDAQRDEVVDLFQEGRSVYEALARG